MPEETKEVQHYPSFRYHRTEPPVIVNNPDEDDALGKEWAETPAAFLDKPKAKKEEKPKPEAKKEEKPKEPEPPAAQ